MNKYFETLAVLLSSKGLLVPSSRWLPPATTQYQKISTSPVTVGALAAVAAKGYLPL